MVRCCNIDWLEVYCLESESNYPVDADYFRRQGLRVEERAYGTRVYDQMFKILDDSGEPFIEVRRKPVGVDAGNQVLDFFSCHIRLSNAYCYVDNPAVLLRDFLARHGYTFKRISRVDVCLDFERFDLGDDPQNFVRRYIAHRYAKINQANRTTHGTDRWDGCVDNSLSWGAPKSMVSTKMYNKSLELSQVRDKPYIRYSWFAAGLVSDPNNLTKRNKDGCLYTPVIWRVEFSVKSGAAGWAILEDCTHAKTKLVPVENTLSSWDTAEKIFHKFASLAHHYFHFKYYQPGVRKDRCKDKVLFVFDFSKDRPLKLQRPFTSTPKSKKDASLLNALRRYAHTHFYPDVRHACEVIINSITSEQINGLCANGWDAARVRELRLLIRQRLDCPDEEFEVTLERVRRLLTANDNGFF